MHPLLLRLNIMCLGMCGHVGGYYLILFCIMLLVVLYSFMCISTLHKQEILNNAQFPTEG